MKIILYQVSIFLFFILIAPASIAQISEIDSLKRELDIHTRKDTLRVNLLNELSYAYYRTDLEKTKRYLKEAEVISAKIDYKKGKAKCNYIKGILELKQGQFDQSVFYFKQALELNKSIGFKEGVSECYSGLGVTFYYAGEFNQAIENYKKALVIEGQIGNKETVPNILHNLGSAYMEMGDYDDALNYYKRALTLNQALNDKDGLASSYNNIGTLYDEQCNYPLALEYYNKSLAISEKIGDSIGIANASNNIGIIYKNYENYDKAIEYYSKALGIHQARGNSGNVAKALNNLGNAYRRKGDYISALKMYDSALKIARSINDKDHVSTCLNNLGDAYLERENYSKALLSYEEAMNINQEIEDKRGLCNSYLGIATVYTHQRNYEKALDFSLKSKAIADELNLLNFRRDVSELLSKIYKKTGNFELALSSHEQFKLLSDSLFNKENIEKITQLEYEFMYKNRLESARNRELKLTNKVAVTHKDLEKSQRNYLLAIIGFLLLTILLGSIIFYMRFRNIKSKNQNIVIEQKLLRSQMTPHFIFNSLSVLQGMILNKEEKKSVSYLSKFSKLLRIILENSRDKTVSLAQELAAIENYLGLQNLESEAYTYSISVEDNVNVALFAVPPMLIQPFVENAIEHAFVAHNGNKIIDVHLAYLDQDLICTITDNGIGIDAQTEKKERNKTSLSTTITNERLKILSKDFKLKGTINIEDRRKNNKQGTIVTIVIPHKIQPEQ